MVEVREVIRCRNCKLNQYVTKNNLCRRCKYSLSVEPTVKREWQEVAETSTDSAAFKTAMDRMRGVTIG